MRALDASVYYIFPCRLVPNKGSLSALLAMEVGDRPKAGAETVEDCSNTVLPKCLDAKSILYFLCEAMYIFFPRQNPLFAVKSEDRLVAVGW